jgi:hypothetical protein
MLTEMGNCEKTGIRGLEISAVIWTAGVSSTLKVHH